MTKRFWHWNSIHPSTEFSLNVKTLVIKAKDIFQVFDGMLPCASKYHIVIHLPQNMYSLLYFFSIIHLDLIHSLEFICFLGLCSVSLYHYSLLLYASRVMIQSSFLADRFHLFKDICAQITKAQDYSTLSFSKLWSHESINNKMSKVHWYL